MSFNVDLSALNKLRTVAAGWSKSVKSATQSAFKSAAFFLRKELKDAVANNKFGWPTHQIYTNPNSPAAGHSIAALLKANRPQAGQKADDWTLNIPSKEPQMLGKLKNVFRYMAGSGSDDPYAIIGVLGKYATPTAERIMTAFQTGESIAQRYDQNSMRRYFGALGMPIRSSTMLNLPPRPLFGKVMDESQDKVNAAIAEKIDQKMAGKWFEGFV